VSALDAHGHQATIDQLAQMRGGSGWMHARAMGELAGRQRMSLGQGGQDGDSCRVADQ
jgi:hypothetical protein